MAASPADPSPAVLVVDDSKVSRQLVIGLLRNRLPALRFLEAADGESACALAQAQPLRLVVMDYNMPGIHGVEAALRIRAGQPGVPIVLLTANAQTAVQAKADAAGVSFMRKPVKPELADRIAAMLIGAPEPAQQPAQPPAQEPAPAATGLRPAAESIA